MQVTGRYTSSLFVVVALLVGGAMHARAHPVVTDALYAAHHPRLLFSPGETAALAAKMHDGGDDDDAYTFILNRVRNVYPTQSAAATLGPWLGLSPIPEIGLVAHLESPPDSVARALGRMLTIYIVDTYAPDFDDAGSSMRLRSLALGYDLFFRDATEAQRAHVRDEIVAYIQKMIWNPGYRLFELHPYLGNHSAMIAGALGLASIALRDEADAYLLDGARDLADSIVQNLIEYQFDPDGAYNEGGLYALWTLRNLAYYFEARKRFDGFTFGDNLRLRAVERWLAYELLPNGVGLAHNLNDSGYTTLPFARHTTYFDWAMHDWDSGLAAWLWEHTAGVYGTDMGAEADKFATALWHRELPQVQPGSVLPLHHLWAQRGLYVFRTGWQTGLSSGDVMFSFYSGKFEGGHAQEDQNQFALYAYGSALAVDNGPGTEASQSEAHNMVFVDGQGQHNAGSSIGTDGRIAEYVLGGYADYVMGDATQAYGTHSAYNDPDRPVEGTSWAWGYKGANPVLYAYRRAVVVHGGTVPPYVVIMDDLDKDGFAHDYEWRMHTRSMNTVSTAANPLSISGGSATMDMHVLNPSWDSLSVATEPFDGNNDDPTSTLLRIARTAVNPAFSLLLMPRPAAESAPTISRDAYSWGYACEIRWGHGATDYLIRNDSGQTVTHALIETDALITWVRRSNGSIEGLLAVDASHLAYGQTTLATIYDGRVSYEYSGSTINLDRYDADFRFHGAGITNVRYRDQSLPFSVDGADVVSGGPTAVSDPPAPRALAVSAHPNPFNPDTMVRVSGDAATPTQVAVYDVTGRRVRLLWDAPLRTSTRLLRWEGRNDAGAPVASGTYFLRASTPSDTRSLKVTLLK